MTLSIMTQSILGIAVTVSIAVLSIKRLSIECCSAGFNQIKCGIFCHSVCHYAKCRYAESHGTLTPSSFILSQGKEIQKGRTDYQDNDTQHNDTHHIGNQYEDTRHDDNHSNDILYYDTQHNGFNCSTHQKGHSASSVVMLNVIMLGVVMLVVMAFKGMNQVMNRRDLKRILTLCNLEKLFVAQSTIFLL